jgi:hypothetical protein
VDGWAWSRSKSKTDPGPLIAASIAFRLGRRISLVRWSVFWRLPNVDYVEVSATKVCMVVARGVEAAGRSS